MSFAPADEDGNLNRRTLANKIEMMMRKVMESKVMKTGEMEVRHVVIVMWVFVRKR